MAYRLAVSEQAELQIDSLLRYLLFNLGSRTAAGHLLDSLEDIYARLKDEPFQFPLCRDIYLEARGYRKAIITGMDYIVIFSIVGEDVHIHGVYHQSEDFEDKLQIYDR